MQGLSNSQIPDSSSFNRTVICHREVDCEVNRRKVAVQKKVGLESFENRDLSIREIDADPINESWTCWLFL